MRTTWNTRRAVERAAAIVRRGLPVIRTPTVGIVLGSTGSAFADTLVGRTSVTYEDLGEQSGFIPPGVAGHDGTLATGRCGSTNVIVMCGRAHCYEGHTARQVAFPVRVLIALGARVVILTNAAGGINPAYAVGDLVAMSDHLNCTGANPLAGPNDPALGVRFPDMTEAYDPTLRALTIAEARAMGLPGHTGVYAAMSGPSYETPAEIRMLQRLGADLVGMSTVHETIAAQHMGARVLGISLVSNLAAGIASTPLSHEEVTAAALRASTTLTELLTRVIASFAARGILS